MSIPDEEIDKHLKFLLNNSDPGDTLDAITVVAAPRGPDGEPDVDKAQTYVFVLACDDSMKPSDFAVVTIANAAVRYEEEGKVPLFAALKIEAWSVEPFDELAQQLRAAGRPYSEHPNAGEITIVYAAARDGRRWDGRRWLTGPHAGTTEGPTQFTSDIHHDEGPGHPARAIRKLVGIHRR